MNCRRAESDGGGGKRGDGNAAGLHEQRQTPPADERAFAFAHPRQKQDAPEDGRHRDIHSRDRLHVEMHGRPPDFPRLRKEETLSGVRHDKF